jgi:hypothetical protein
VVRFLDLVVGDPIFLVMEYVPGPTLAAVLKEKGKLDLERAANICARLCWGLDAAHSVGVIHRDIKPANVILAPDAELGEEPKLIDFGLAKLANAAPEDALTRTGQIVGTPYYMSPEQIANRTVDERSDVYALGCLLHHMTTGAPPFTGEEVQLLYQHIEQPPEPLRKLRPEAPAALEAILLRALAKQPDRRFPTMREMARALKAIEWLPAPGRSFGDEPENTARVPAVKSPPPSPRWPWLVGVAVASAISAGVTWKLTARSGGGLLLVTSRPPGAAVELDGRKLGEVTPAAVHGVAPGRHRVRVVREGNAPGEQYVELGHDGRASVDVSMQPESRTVQVTSDPSGALVYLDGRLQVGQTPLQLAVTGDDFHQVRAEKAGYATATHDIKPEDRAPALNLELTADRDGLGTLWLDSNQGGEVFIDGGDTGMVTPTVGIRLPGGEHRVELRGSDGRTIAASPVKVAPGQSVHFTLDAAPGPHK